ncbi:MAG: PH domain-containing protein [Pseudomonadota bacterium]|uniref:PH domain-containing protein n=1 Tax=Sphingobium sp. KCTC 72723 TaxID=2733867 RepID=UPI00165DD02B|nr:PH domain-containing protein [Sphingobium sp. KCTC 72723]
MSEAWLYDEHPAMFRAHPLLFTLLLVSVVGIVAIGIWWVLHKGERLALSEREVLLERGLLAKQRTEVALSSIRSVRITQSLGQRLFDVGHVELFSAGDVAEIAVKNMPRPGRIRAIAAARNLDLLPQR